MTIFRHRIRKFIERLWTSPFPDVLARESFLRASIYIRRVNGDSIMRWKRFDPRKNTKRNEIQSSSRISTFRRFRSNHFLTCENMPLYSLRLCLLNLFLSSTLHRFFPKSSRATRLRSQEISYPKLSGLPPEISSQLSTTRSLSSVTSISGRVSFRYSVEM